MGSKGVPLLDTGGRNMKTEAFFQHLDQFTLCFQESKLKAMFHARKQAIRWLNLKSKVLCRKTVNVPLFELNGH